MNRTYPYQLNLTPIKQTLGVVLIGPDESRRRMLATAFEPQQATITAELGGYPGYNRLAELAESDCDVVLVDLDTDPDVALDLVETICSRNPAITVMVYSRRQDPDLLVRCMQAGTREFLSEPVTSSALAEAMVRASARRGELETQQKLLGRVLVFWGAKGGAGVTTLATNFAIALRSESGAEVGLVDLHLDLGDVAVMLGLAPRFNISDALNNFNRLDEDFMTTLLTEHRSGVAVLAAPDKYTAEAGFPDGSLVRLLHLLRSRFPYLVVDAGPSLGPAANLLFQVADAVYLVTQAEIPSLRNAQRMLLHFQTAGVAGGRLEVVVNRHDARRTPIEVGQIEKALGVQLRWKVPNDFYNVRRSLDEGAPLALENSPVSRVVRQMARVACGKPATPPSNKKWLNLFG